MYPEIKRHGTVLDKHLPQRRGLSSHILILKSDSKWKQPVYFHHTVHLLACSIELRFVVFLYRCGKLLLFIVSVSSFTHGWLLITVRAPHYSRHFVSTQRGRIILIQSFASSHKLSSGSLTDWLNKGT